MQRSLVRGSAGVGLALVATAITAVMVSPVAATGATVPSAPGSVYAVPYKNGGASLKWKAPTSNGGAPITGYVVTPYKGGVARPSVTFKGAKTTYLVTSLHNGTSYRFGVAALNAVGTGARSPLSGAMIVGTPGQPGKPVIDKIERKFSTPLAPGQVFLSAARPARGAWQILHMNAKCSTTNGGQSRAQILVSEGPASKVSGLTVGKTYRCTVTATNRFGTGRPSVLSNALTV